MQSILFRQSPLEAELLILDLWENGTVGIMEDSAGLRAFFEDGNDLSALLAKYSESILDTRSEQSIAYQPASDEWDSVLAGERFFIVPAGSTYTPPPGRMTLAVEATTAFGSGRHESTQLMIEALEKLLKPGDTVLDVGCGSGILLAAAAMLGAGQLFGCDIHLDAIHAARKQVFFPLFLGAADSIWDRAADLVLANISASVVDTLAFDLNRVAKPGGSVVLSGFIGQNVPKRFSPHTVVGKGDWLCWICLPQQLASEGSVQPFTQQWW